MSEERPKGFLSRVFGPPDEEEHTSVYSSDDFNEEYEYGEEEEGYEEERIEETSGSFTVERAAEIIKHLPPEVPRSSAVRIVRQTLVAAGINIEDLATSTRARDSKLNSEINLRRRRIKELQDKTENVVRDLEGQIRRAREARDTGISNEERRISTAEDGLEDIEHVRDFFGLPRNGSEYDASANDDEGERTTSEAGDETQIIDRVEEGETSDASDSENQDETRVIRGPLSERWESERENRENR
ncbi:MAG: hypothetical protein H0U65_14310 [Rubrobacter sp.]|jgi:hypothetical protein|nr:hypothetical protein [Rubrobacter sp.]